MRTIHTAQSATRKAVVKYDHIDREYVVTFYLASFGDQGILDYKTDDKQDAIDEADHWAGAWS